MGRRLVRQPNGLWAVWSSIVDNFTWEDLSQLDAFKSLLYDGFSINDAWESVHTFAALSDENHQERWDDCIETISRVHGSDEAYNVVLRLGEIKRHPNNERLAYFRESVSDEI